MHMYPHTYVIKDKNAYWKATHGLQDGYAYGERKENKSEYSRYF